MAFPEREKKLFILLQPAKIQMHQNKEIKRNQKVNIMHLPVKKRAQTHKSKKNQKEGNCANEIGFEVIEFD